MSKPNKANKNNYNQAGRLTPDDLARERKRQAEVSAHAKGKEQVRASAPYPRPKTEEVRGRGERAATRRRTAPEE
jgi:hypothetical protein